MRGPANTGYYRLGLDSLGAPRIACSRLEAAGRRIAQQFFVQHAIDKAVVRASSHPIHNITNTALELPTKQKDLQYLQKILPYSGPDLQSLVHSAETHPLKNATPDEMKRLLSKSKQITKIIAETANKSHLWASDWIKVLTKLLSTQKITEAQLIIESLVATGERLPLGILAAALKVARIKGSREAFHHYAACCPLPGIPIPYPPTQLQLVVSQVRYHRSPKFAGASPLHLQFFSGNWWQDPGFPDLLKALSQGFLKYHDPEMLDSVMWWANDSKALNSHISYVNLAAARQWDDPQRAWWTWQQVQANGLENSYLREMAEGFACLRSQLKGKAHIPGQMLIEATPRE